MSGHRDIGFEYEEGNESVEEEAKTSDCFSLDLSSNQSEYITLEFFSNPSEVATDKMTSNQYGKQLESGESSNSATPGEPSAINESDDDPLLPTPTKVGEHMGFLLCEKWLTQSDVEPGRLLIPVELAVDHCYPLLHPQSTYETTIKLTGPENRDMSITVNYQVTESAFVIDSEWWEQIVRSNNVEAMDVIRFYKPVVPSHEYHFLYDFVKRSSHPVPEFKPENFLFELGVSTVVRHWLTKYRKLVVPKMEVGRHFPAVGITAKTHDAETLYFTDAENKDWFIQIIFGYGHYMLVLDEEFVNRYNWRVGDTIRFYKPVHPLHSQRHFLIEIVQVTDPSDSKTVVRDGNADEEEKGDKGGSPRWGRKWWRFALGGCCRTEEAGSRKYQLQR